MTIRFVNPEERRRFKAQRRLRILHLSLCAGYLVIAGRGIFLMLQDNHKLEKIAVRQYRAAIQKETNRGRMLDRKGRELAINVPAWSLYTDPRYVKNPKGLAAHLSKILNIPSSLLYQKLTAPRRFLWLKRGVDAKTIEKILAIKPEGVYTLKENKRYYPHGDLASPLLGEVGVDSQALSGIELAYDGYLLTTSPSPDYLKDARGRLYLASTSAEKITDKGDVYLTIDKNIQFFTETALRRAVGSASAKGGIAIVMEPRSGDILAMANVPGPKNRAVTDLYEPGSTFKAILTAGALEDGNIQPEEKFFCENGEWMIPGGHIINDHHPHGLLSTREIIQVSSNIGAYKIAKRMGKKKMHEWIRAFGFGSKVGIDFPGESAGLATDYRRWGPIEEATVAFGQGIGVSPLQMISAFSAIANGGVRMRPHLVEKAVGPEGGLLYSSTHEILGQPIRYETARKMGKILRGVVEEGGTAPLADIKEYPVAGKTGTAQKVNSDRKGYAEGKYIASFIGFAPVSDPKLAVLVLIDEPKGSYYGGQIAAPVFKEIMLYALQNLGLPPERERGLWTLRQAQGTAADRGQRKEEQPAAREIFPAHGPWAVVRGPSSFQIPDFTGASVRHVLKAVAPYPVAVEFKGRGIARSQSPKAGTFVTTGSRIYVEFGSAY